MDVQEALRALSNKLRQVLSAVSYQVTPDALGPFRSEDELPRIPDYEDWVPIVQWMSLGKIENRLLGKGDCLYLRPTDMIADFHQITQNAEMYNAPGNGRLGNQVLMDTARQLLQLVSTEVEKHREELDQLEEDLAQALDADEGALHKPAWPGAFLSKAGMRRIPEHTEAHLLSPHPEQPEDVHRLMFFTRGKPEGVVNFGVHCRKHPHEGIVAGSLVLLDRIKEVKRWFATHWHCREDWQNFAPRAGETVDEYKERLGHIFSFSKTAVSHQRITYPRHFASSVPSAAPVAVPQRRPAEPEPEPEPLKPGASPFVSPTQSPVLLQTGERSPLLLDTGAAAAAAKQDAQPDSSEKTATQDDEPAAPHPELPSQPDAKPGTSAAVQPSSIAPGDSKPSALQPPGKKAMGSADADAARPDASQPVAKASSVPGAKRSQDSSAAQPNGPANGQVKRPKLTLKGPGSSDWRTRLTSAVTAVPATDVDAAIELLQEQVKLLAKRQSKP